MKINRVGVDLAKNVFQLHGSDNGGKVAWKRRLSRGKWLAVLCDTAEPGTEIGMEACAGAHHWARQLMRRGYAVKIIPPQFVKPFIKSNKKDANDAHAICEAMGRPNMHPVKVKQLNSGISRQCIVFGMISRAIGLPRPIKSGDWSPNTV
jgi:transposase